MPVQFAPVIAAAVVALSASMELVAAATLTSRVISADSVLRAWCMIGAVIGGVLAVVIWAPTDPNSKIGFRMALIKFISAFFLGVLCGPMACRYVDLQPDQDLVMFVAGAIAFVGVPLIHHTAPAIARVWERFAERWLTSKANRYLDEKDNMGGS